MVVDAPGFRTTPSEGGANLSDLFHNYVQEKLQNLFHENVFNSTQELYLQVMKMMMMMIMMVMVRMTMTLMVRPCWMSDSKCTNGHDNNPSIGRLNSQPCRSKEGIDVDFDFPEPYSSVLVQLIDNPPQNLVSLVICCFAGLMEFNDWRSTEGWKKLKSLSIVELMVTRRW